MALDGPLACERIIDVLQKTVDGLSKLPKPSLRNRLEGWYKATKRRGRQRSKSRDTSSHKLLEFQRHKYPQISLEELRARIERFQHLLDDHGELKVDQIFDKLFLISP